MFRFGFNMGSGSGMACPRPSGELIRNWTYECDDLYWKAVNATVTYPDENCRVVREGSAGRAQQSVYLSPGTYKIQVEIINTNSSGFVIVAPPGGSGEFPLDYLPAGVHSVIYEATVGGTYTIGVGTNNPDGSHCEFGYLSVMEVPDWWMIDSLDDSDILGAWDFAWNGNKSRDEALVPLDGSLGDFTIDTGNPGWAQGTGITFGGSGNIKVSLPEVEVHNMSVIMQFSDATQNGTLDAFFSHYIAASHYTLQNKFSDGTVRWSCGDGDSPTLEVPGEMITEGVYGVSGPRLHIDGHLAGVQPDEGTAISSGLDFRLGCIYAGSGNTQYVKAKVQKLLIVKRRLTDAEQNCIYSRINGQPCLYDNLTTNGGELLTTNAGLELIAG